MIDFYGTLVGKYTSSMDPVGWSCFLFSHRENDGGPRSLCPLNDDWDPQIPS